jgi:hypothetical protein
MGSIEFSGMTALAKDATLARFISTDGFSAEAAAGDFGNCVWPLP